MVREEEPKGGWARVEAVLAERGAEGMPHPGGTLLEHLIRVRRMLAEWGSDAAVQAAGLSHAAYGTDGFGRSLLAVTERMELTDLIGERAEALVYLYASCEREQVYPRLGTDAPVLFRDRFTGTDHVPQEADLRAFVEITAANELDVLAHNEDLAEQYGADLYGLFASSRELLSPRAWTACRRQLGHHVTERT